MEVLCPICHKKLFLQGKQARCENRHSFDIAKEGYLNFNRHSASSGDAKELIDARRSFLQRGYYAFLKDEIVSLTEKYQPEVLCDLACGEGYYTKEMKADMKFGIDLSRQALRYASRTDKSTFYLLTSIFELPFPDESLDMVTTIFAPLADREITRVLKKGGLFLYVRPNERHLYELKEILYERVRENEIRDIPIEGMEKVKEYAVSSRPLIDHDGLLDLFHMTPYGVKTGREGREKLENTSEKEVSLDFLISIYQKL